MMHPLAVLFVECRPKSVAVGAAFAVIVAGCASEAAPFEPSRSLMDPWQPTPFGVAQATIIEAERVCSGLDIPREDLPLVAVDARGGTLLYLVYAGPAAETDCILQFDGSRATGDAGGSSSSGDAIVSPGPGEVTVFDSGIGGGFDNLAYTTLIGLVGPGVNRVEIVTTTGRRLDAALGPTGWFAAWWPGNDEYASTAAYDPMGARTGTAP
jgi:hypothetical protein